MQALRQGHQEVLRQRQVQDQRKQALNSDCRIQPGYSSHHPIKTQALMSCSSFKWACLGCLIARHLVAPKLAVADIKEL